MGSLWQTVRLGAGLLALIVIGAAAVQNHYHPRPGAKAQALQRLTFRKNKTSK